MVESLSNNADKADVDAEVEAHRQNETHAADQPPENHALGGGVHDASTRAAINGLVSDAALESEQGAQGRVDNHTATEVHDEPQPPAGKGEAGGVAELDDTGALRSGQVPDLAVTGTFTVQTESDLTGLSAAEEGDVGIVLDQSTSYILSGSDPSSLSNWAELQAPPAPVQDVFGRTGSVSPSAGDYSASQITNFNSSAADAAPVQSVNGRTGTVSGLFEASDYNPETDTHDRYTDSEASSAAPVQDVEGKTGNVTLGPSDVEAEPSGSVETHRQNETHATAQPPQSHDNTAHAVDYATASDAIDTRRAVNQLVVQNAEQDFELGLNLLEYDDGQYEVFANDTNIASSTGLTLYLGSPLDNAGYVTVATGDISVEEGSFNNVEAPYSIFVDGEFGFSGGNGNKVRKWDVGTMSQQNEFTGHTDQVRSVFVDGNYGYSAGDFDDKTVKKWDVDTLTEQDEFTGHSSAVNSVFIDGSFGYSASSSSNVKKWDVDTMTEQAVYEGVDTMNVVFVNGSYGYSGDFAGTINKWDVDTMTEQDTSTLHGYGVTDLHVADGFGYSADGVEALKKWDVDTLTEQDQFTGHTDSPTSVFIDGDYGYSGGEDGEVKKWDVDTMTEQSEFTGHGPDVVNIVFVDGNYGYSAGGDYKIKKWSGVGAPETSGSVQHTFQDLGFIPEEAVINDDLRQPLPANADVYYKIEDADGNSQTIQRSNIDSTVDLTGFTSSSVSTTALIERDDTTVESPQLDAWALYLTGA